jgi:hypothetical protein
LKLIEKGFLDYLIKYFLFFISNGNIRKLTIQADCKRHSLMKLRFKFEFLSKIKKAEYPVQPSLSLALQNH